MSRSWIGAGVPTRWAIACFSRPTPRWCTTANARWAGRGVSVLPLGFRSHFRYFRKFDGRGTELAVRAITLLQMGLRALASAGMLAVSTGAERARWHENWRAYTAVMREALRIN